MFDYSSEIEEFWEKKVRLSEPFKEKLFGHRKANRDRLISRLPNEIQGLTISDSSFKPQGSMAMRTIIQTKFGDEEYDIDDGLILKKEELINKEGKELSTEEVRDIVRDTLKDERFVKQPKLCTNCVRVYYSEADAEKHHVDFPIYRSFEKNGDIVREIANENEWIESNPTQINSWFENEVIARNADEDGKGTQLRKLIQLLKRFARSRQAWDLPNGLKLTMLAAECQDCNFDKIDRAFRELLIKMDARLEGNKVIKNLAHPNKLDITRTSSDPNVESLHEKVKLALDKLNELDDVSCDRTNAKQVWDWIFKSDGYFDSITDENTSANSFASHTPNRVVEHKGGGRFG